MCFVQQGERLWHFAYVWRKFQASPEIINLVENGHEIQCEKLPPCYVPGPNDETVLSPDKMEIVREEVKSLILKVAVRQLTTSEVEKVPGYYLKMFCVSKPDGL